METNKLPEAIIVDDFNKFQQIKVPFSYDYLFKSGYWNVFRYTKQLEDFLKENDIVYRSIGDAYKHFNRIRG